MEEGGNEPFLLVPVVAEVAIPEQEIALGSGGVEALEGFLVLMGVIPNDE